MDATNPFAPLKDDELAQQATRSIHDDWRPLIPIPETAPKLPRALVDRVAPADFEFGAIWRYHTAQGDRAFFVVRYDKPANGTPADKQIRPFCYCEGPNGKTEWRSKALTDNRPLYRLDLLTIRPDAPVLVVEGEKTADAAAQRFPDFVVTTSSSGAKAAAKTDWNTLKGRKVTIWPDADAAGAAYAEAVSEILEGVRAAEVGIVKLPDGLPDGWDLADDRPPGVSEGDLTALLKLKTQHSAELGTWSNPDLSLLGTGRRAAPEFPLNLLGEWGNWVERRAAAASAPTDYVATALLACAGAAIANVRWPLAGASWSEPPLLWCGLVGSPSSGKSPSMDMAFSLVHHAEEQMASGYDEEKRTFETERQTAKATREAWEAEVKAAVKAGEKPRQMPAEAEVSEMPPRPRIRVADATIEAMAKLAAALPRGLLLVRDELAGWFGSFDRYGGGGSDRAFAIEMYGGRPYVVDRVKNAEAIRIPHLSFGVLGGVQPDKLAVVLEGPDDGLVARMLWSWPERVPDFSLIRQDAEDLAAGQSFARLTHLAMGSDQFGSPEPKRLPLTREAEHYLESYAREVGRRAHEATGVMAGALGKARGHVLRLGAILEHLWWCLNPRAQEPQEISANATLAACGLVDGYFLPMAERVFGDASIPLKDRLAMLLVRRLRQDGRASFNAKEVRRQVGGPLREADAMDAACAVLIDAGVIRAAPSREGGTKGRQSKTYEVNSRALEEKS